MRYVLLLVFSVSLIGCLDEEDNPLSMLTSDRDKLLETWYISADEIAAVVGGNEDLQGLESYEITYDDDGTFSQEIMLSVEGIAFKLGDSGTWTLEGSTLTHKYADGDLFANGDTAVFSAIITDVSLTLTDSEGTTIVFRKKDS
ncbi:MAG: lipocalin family protein [Candidatus Latescibacterota bacterium]